jgi:flagellar biosynthetic protein FliR
MTVTIEGFDFFLLILVRITGFIYTAPFFSLKNVPIRVKTGLSIFLTIILFYSIPGKQPEYYGVIGYAILIVKELIVGVLMGYFSNIAYHILSFSGQMMDMEIGFSMANEFNPISQVQTTITSNLYGYLVMLIMMISNLHHYFLKAMIDSFKIIGVGKAIFHTDLYKVMVHFITEYFIIGFRIVLPIFASILMVNTILAILAKVAPQMNMFVIGMQLKVLVGLFVLSFVIQLIPSVSDFIFNDMIEMLKEIIKMIT